MFDYFTFVRMFAFLEKESPDHTHTWCFTHVFNLVLCEASITNHVSIS